jgi:two-component sensor histidine kinase
MRVAPEQPQRHQDKEEVMRKQILNKIKQNLEYIQGFAKRNARGADEIEEVGEIIKDVQYLIDLED